MSGALLLAGLTATVWLSCGLAAVCLTPRNHAARSLLAAAVLLAATLTTEQWLSAGQTGDAAFAVGRTVAEVTFLGMLAAVVGTLVTHPGGRVDRAWHGWVPRALAVTAVLAPLAELVGSARLDLGNEPATARANPAAVDSLDWLGALGSAVGATEPAWIVAGVLLLLLRWRQGDPVRRAQLRAALLSLVLLTALLALVVLGVVAGVPTPHEAVFGPALFLALSLFPVVVLAGITRQVRELEGNLADSRARLVGAEDRARQELAHDLHDGTQQQLVALLSLTELARLQVSDGRTVASTTLSEASELTRQAVVDLRDLVHGIRPPVLEDSGLVAALRARVGRLPADVHLDASADRRWHPLVEITAYHVVNEAVTNCLKHAPGSAVRIRIEELSRDLVVSVSDTGRGAGTTRVAVPPGSGGWGLTGMRDRVESMGGRLDVSTEPGGGTRVTARLPQPSEAAR